MKNTIAIIPAAGSASRMGFNKITSKLNGIPLLARTIQAISIADSISGIIVAVPSEKISEVKNNIVDKYNLNKVMKIVAGGKTRTETVWNALQAIEQPVEIVAIHDGARPFISTDIIE
ncbi:2-C-methyl-D-erythritol 4-phosphate cytidylyltransferase, partial [bacterium]|nr:2-C-methyl-D-erythritol 4-phosphate cytidylyltransferase [bacterium]